eukprot:CAMPEP_0198432150 /NCGR_PEP_ID=MMETSP1452-20131203/21881_1 /TAXON_ID=1181717 /ORGANISM="Synchroma pusillum, Strain CCMP3072" /LENGTH=154 /DNA_ID=CAMNT_0044152623 /DNA_START=1 /DNA_END=462 /DNA_ORIENTATION=-
MGLQGWVWEVGGTHNSHVVVQLVEPEDKPEAAVLTFRSASQPQRRFSMAFSLFRARNEAPVAPVAVRDIFEVLPGHLDYERILSHGHSSQPTDASPRGSRVDPSLYLSIVTIPDASAGASGQSRRIVLELPTRQERNHAITGIRLLSSDALMTT